MEFEISKLKKRPAYPFETIAVGLSFSPRMETLLGEAKKIADVCGSKLVLIHVGEKSSTVQSFRTLDSFTTCSFVIT